MTMSLRPAGRTSSTRNHKYAGLLLFLAVACYFAIARLLFYPLHSGGVIAAGVGVEKGGGGTSIVTDDAIARMARRAVHPVPYNFSRTIDERARGRGRGGGGGGK